MQYDTVYTRTHKLLTETKSSSTKKSMKIDLAFVVDL